MKPLTTYHELTEGKNSKLVGVARSLNSKATSCLLLTFPSVDVILVKSPDDKFRYVAGFLSSKWNLRNIVRIKPSDVKEEYGLVTIRIGLLTADLEQSKLKMLK